jgi:hydrogenase/urease accessory protein HupE
MKPLELDDAFSMSFLSFMNLIPMGRLPVLFVCGLGVILALLFWRRCPRPCALALAAMVVLMSATLAHAYLPEHIMNLFYKRGWPTTDVALTTLSSGFHLANALAVALLIAAAIIGRRTPIIDPSSSR